MRSKIMFPVVTLILAAILAAMVSYAGAQTASLQQELAKQYKLAKMGSDTSGYSIVEEGTLLAVQKGGVIGVPYKDSSPLLTNKYENGVVHPPNLMARKGWDKLRTHMGQEEQTTRLFKPGEKVYATKVEVNLDKDTVSMGIVACDTCNKTDPPTYNKAQVVFVFPKGSLAKASADDVKNQIAQLLSVSNEEQKSDGGDQEQGAKDSQENGDPSAKADAPQQQAEPQEVKLGMSTDEVETALGKPVKKFSAGPKQIYVYSDMKITFKDGKVSDVQ